MSAWAYEVLVISVPASSELAVRCQRDDSHTSGIHVAASDILSRRKLGYNAVKKRKTLQGHLVVAVLAFGQDLLLIVQTVCGLLCSTTEANVLTIAPRLVPGLEDVRSHSAGVAVQSVAR
jgi:hypothetical protein